MGAAGEEVSGEGVLQPVAPLLQKCHIPGKGGRVAGNIHDAPGGEPGKRLDGIGI